MIFNISVKTRFSKLFNLSILTLTFFTLFASQALANTCKVAGQQLRGDYEVTQSRGGLWGYMEKAGSLRKDSMIGLQMDSKMQRLVVFFETKCENGTPPPQAAYEKIAAELGKARQIVNKTPGRTPIKKIKEMIAALNQSLDKILGELGI